MEQWYIRENNTLTVIPRNTFTVSVTNPDFACMKTESGEQVGLRFTSEDFNFQVRVVFGIEEFDAILAKIKEL
jgi:hypothetical protein